MHSQCRHSKCLFPPRHHSGSCVIRCQLLQHALQAKICSNISRLHRRHDITCAKLAERMQSTLPESECITWPFYQTCQQPARREDMAQHHVYDGSSLTQMCLLFLCISLHGTCPFAILQCTESCSGRCHIAKEPQLRVFCRLSSHLRTCLCLSTQQCHFLHMQRGRVPTCTSQAEAVTNILLAFSLVVLPVPAVLLSGRQEQRSFWA